MKERCNSNYDPNCWNCNSALVAAANPEPLKKIAESGAISASDIVELVFSVENLFAFIEIFFD